MIQGERLAALLPHAGAMVLLDAVDRWDASHVRCRTRSHLDPSHPLRRDGQVSAVCGVEYGLQAAALHGALLAGGVRQRIGFVARLRDMTLHAGHLAEGGGWLLMVEAVLERQEANGMVYALKIMGQTADDRWGVLVSARASIALPT